jgi:hypothetical protein
MTAPTTAEYHALARAIRTFLDVSGFEELPANVKHIGFDTRGQLREHANGAAVRGLDGRVTILIRAGRPLEDIKRTTLHELRHASDWLDWPWITREQAEQRAETFAERYT